MRDKSIREMNSSSDSNGPPRHDQRTRRARGNSTAFHEGDLAKLSDDMNQDVVESFQEDMESSSPDDKLASKKRSFIPSQVIGLFPFGRGRSQRLHVTNTDQQDNTHSKPEEDFVALQKTCEALEKDGRNASIEIKQLRSRLQNAEDQLENTKSLARKEVQGHQNDIKSIKACNGRLRSDLETAENKIVGLQAEIHTADEKFQTSEISAAEEISRLTTDVDMVNEELFKEKNSARKEIAQLQSQIKLLNEKNDKFRQILIPVSEKQVLDAEVVQRFTSLRTSMLALVRRTWKPAFRDDADVISLSQDQIHVFKFGGMCDYDRLRYAVFHFIHDRIIGNRNYFLENGFEETEKRLQLVEQELFEKSPVEDRKQVIEWRSASFKATECFRGSGRVLSRETQSQIWDFFGPIQTANPEAEEIGRKKLEEICDAAVDFSLVTRQLKDNFWVDGMRRAVGQPVSEWDHLVEEMASVTAGKGKQPGTIAYVIVGALIKYPRENLEKALVLEKAEVGVYR